MTIDAGPTGADMNLSLTLDALALRSVYSALVVFLQNAPFPVIWDLGRDMKLTHKVVCYGAPTRICITAFGMRPDETFKLIYRNWGSASDPLPGGTQA